MIFPSYGVVVLTPAIRVCPGKAGLYVELGERVSTGAALLFAVESFALLLLAVLLVLQAKRTTLVQTTIEARTLIMT
jgi:hypothetical protein